MPLTRKGVRIRASLRRRYGKRKGDRIFYAGERKGRFKGVKRRG